MFGFGEKRPSMKALWLDQPDALARIERSRVSDEFKTAARELSTDGFTILRGVVDGDLCARVIDDYYRYARENADYVAQNLDEMGREKRLVNFHLWSEAELAVVANAKVMRLLDYLFDEKACVYTTLTFKYGTQQPLHRDTPHFATWPESRFFGVWTALEDVSAEAGPLMYVKGGQRFVMEHHRDIMRRVQRDRPDLGPQDQLTLALDLYNGQVIQDSPSAGEVVTAPIKRGDVAIWHPQLPHGGSPAVDQMRSRWSVVAHCAPEAVQLYMMDTFFHHDGPEPPPRRYGFLRKAHGRRIADSGATAYM